MSNQAANKERKDEGRKCNITILGKKYETHVHGNSVEEEDEQEQILREAEKLVNRTIADYFNTYPYVTDSVMILSMVSLDFASQFLALSKKAQKDPNAASLKRIEKLLDGIV